MTNPPAPPIGHEPAPRTLIAASGFRPPAGGLEFARPRVPWALGSGLTVLAIAVWAAWFVLTARSVGIVAAPATASINVDEWPNPRVGNHWLLGQGPRHVRVSAAGYISFDDTIMVTDAQLQTHKIELLRLPGHLHVSVVPDTDSEIMIDEKSHGDVPGLIRDIAAGPHNIEIRTSRYLPFYAEVEIEGKGIEQNLSVKLDPAWADVTVDSIPSSAHLHVDGKAVGVAPIKAEILAGRRVVELRSKGYKSWKQTLNVVAGVPVNLGEIVLSKADGRIKMASTPSGANVTIDGEFRGRTPLEASVTPDKSHKIALLKEGYRVLEQERTVGSGELESLTLELTAELATIHLVTTPEDAELLLNGEPHGNATQTLSLPTHEHEITVRKRGYATYQTRITPRKGVEKRFKIRLKTAAEAGQENARTGASTDATRGGEPSPTTPGNPKGFVKTFAKQELKLFIGGEAQLGAARSEPGRQANEVVRAVVLRRPFYFGLREVTNAEYRLFLASHNSGEFSNKSLDNDLQSVANVNWANAALYCNWLSRRDGLPPFYQIKFGEVLGINPDATGYRLPSEAEWEWAARNPPNAEPTTFPWGEKFPPRARSGNYADATAAAIMGNTIAGYDDGYAVSAPVGSFPPNLKGLYDMDGNVAEWVHDFYQAAPPSAATVDALGPSSGVTHVIKGGSWAQGSLTALRASHRDFDDNARDDVGFRLARYAQ